MKMNQVELLNYINCLKGYQGYIQMSDKPISNIWKNFSDISFSHASGFVYEAHFFNGADSVSIKQINSSWLVDETKNVPLTDTQTYFAKDGLKVQMAQIWEEVEDELCEGMKVLKLEKVVFAGFAKGDDK